jgi:hypothetical protein
MNRLTANDCFVAPMHPRRFSRCAGQWSKQMAWHWPLNVHITEGMFTASPVLSERAEGRG